MVEEPKKAARARRERERGSIPPPFTVSIEELYGILEAWLKDGVVVLPECKHESIDEEKWVDACISGMLYKYRPYLENLQISSFTRLVEVSRRTSMSVRKPLKRLTSQTANKPRQPWRRKGKKVEVFVVEEPKKAAKGKKRER